MSFGEIRGQDKALDRLKGSLRLGRLAGAYLFAGPQGIGKYLAARTFAKALNCLSADNAPCDACVSCVKIDKDMHPDVHCIDVGDEEIKIEHIRQLQKDINLRPYEGKKKVFIIRNAHNLNPASAGALLKTLEEPGGNSVIVLVTEKPMMLFKTIVSRCQVIKFEVLPRQELEAVLKRDFAVGADAAHFLAYFCEGRLGRALGLKDQDVLSEKNSVIDEFGIPASNRAGNADISERQDLARLLNILVAWFRDLYLMKTGIASGGLINLDRAAELSRLKDALTFTEIEEIFDYVSLSLSYLKHNINTKLLLANVRCFLVR